MAVFYTGDDISPIEKFYNKIYRIHNKIYKIRNAFLHLNYNRIKSIEYYSLETPEFIEEKMIISKKNISLEDYKNVINILKNNNVLNWNRHYFADYDYCDGGIWKIVIKFSNNLSFKTSGDVEGPENFDKIYDCFEKYIKTSELYKREY